MASETPSRLSVVLLAALAALPAAGSGEKTGPEERAASQEVESLRVEVLAEHPHDPRAFTQGLLWHAGSIYESTGLRGRSSLRRVDPASGEVLFRVDLDPGLFGEGLALAGDRLVQLTWQAGLALVYDLASLEPTGQHLYSGEGWGLTHDGRHLVMSDGGATLRWRDAESFEVVRELEITLGSRPLALLNELEWARGALWANVLGQERIVRIDPQSGRVTAVVDASGLLVPAERRRADVLNGIAYDPEEDVFWLTGKLWPKLFKVRFVAASARRGPAPPPPSR